eukprot:CAMPEP_0185034398 /NCGR_PEP_ID=MMETSP1103-20130426/24262_1 /TAXON_ID=36769 /ORGANISM="Paraphysomonas bandaiensis, Strain Caron Lab Isolate" /LENGTH=689 /DNA_ID=CAMNT_0027571043 /DNA_START=260 /DNA_END=2329 /DNA_ORIENTATION=+
MSISTHASYEGSNGIVLWSNANHSLYSNHLIAGRKVFSGVDGVWQYSVYAKLPKEYEFSSQVGPEFSIQNTRDDGTGTTYTTIGGIQNIASTYIPDKWNIWVESSPNIAVWQVLPNSLWDTVPVVSADTWYNLVLTVDFDSNEYISLTVAEADNSEIHSANLTGIKIASELRSFDPATVLTVEAENLYNNCGSAGSFESKMFYDKLSFNQITNNSDLFTLVWNYEFTRSKEELSWDFNIYSGPFGSSSNAYFIKDNAEIRNGQLFLWATNVSNPGSREYSTAGIGSWSPHAQVYGKWEVEAKLPSGFGLTGYIGLFPTDKSWPPEVDFAELIGRDPTSLFLTQHYNEDGSHAQQGSTVDNGVDWTNSFHLYALEWTPEKLVYYVDGVEVLAQDTRFNVTLMDVAMGIGTGDCNSWVDCPENSGISASALPQAMVVNYIRVYEYINPTPPPSTVVTFSPSAEITASPSMVPEGFLWDHYDPLQLTNMRVFAQQKPSTRIGTEDCEILDKDIMKFETQNIFASRGVMVMTSDNNYISGYTSLHLANKKAKIRSSRTNITIIVQPVGTVSHGSHISFTKRLGLRDPYVTVVTSTDAVTELSGRWNAVLHSNEEDLNDGWEKVKGPADVSVEWQFDLSDAHKLRNADGSLLFPRESEYAVEMQFVDKWTNGRGKERRVVRSCFRVEDLSYLLV